MIWVILEGTSYQVISVNIMLKGDQSELWIERPTGSTTRILVADEETVKNYKEAIDYAVKIGDKVYEM